MDHWEPLEIRGVKITQDLKKRLTTRYAIIPLFAQDDGIILDFIDDRLYEVKVEYSTLEDSKAFEAVKSRAEEAFLKVNLDAKKIESDAVKSAYSYSAQRNTFLSTMWINPKGKILNFSAMDTRPFEKIHELDIVRDSRVFSGH